MTKSKTKITKKRVADKTKNLKGALKVYPNKENIFISAISKYIQNHKSLGNTVTPWKKIENDQELKNIIFSSKKDTCDRCKSYNPAYVSYFTETEFPFVCCEYCYQVVTNKKNKTGVKV